VPDSPKRSYPIALLIGLAIGLVGSVIPAVVGIWSGRSIRWQLLELGTSGAAYLLSIFALFDLSRRLTGQARAATRIAASLFIVGMAWMFLRPLVDVAFGSSEKMMDMWRWGGRVVGLTSCAATIAFTIGSDAWRRAPFAAVIAILASMLTGWIPVVGDKLFEVLYDHRIVYRAFWPMREAVWAACICVMAIPLAKSARPSVPDPRGGAFGFRQAAIAIRVWLVSAIAVGLLGAIMVRSEGTLKVVLVGGPIVMIASMMVCGWGVLGASRSRVDGLPRMLFYFGAGMIAWWAAISAQQVASVYLTLTGGESMFRFEDGLDKWTIVGPLIAAAGMALVGIAISSLARSRSDTVLQTAASVRTALFVILMVISVGLGTQVSSMSFGNTLPLMLAVAATKICALVVLAQLLDLAARALDQAGLPTARVV
jgi:hypothetical protein